MAHANRVSVVVEGVGDDLADPHSAAPVPRVAANNLPQPARRLVKGRHHEGVAVYRQPFEAVGLSMFGERARLREHRGRMHHHVA